MVELINVRRESFLKIPNPLQGYLFFIDNLNTYIDFYVFGPGNLLKAEEDFFNVFPNSSLYLTWKISSRRGLEDSCLGRSGDRLLLKGKRGYYYEIMRDNRGIFGLKVPYDRAYYLNGSGRNSLKRAFGFNTRIIRDSVGREHLPKKERKNLRIFLYENFKKNSLLL